MNCASSEAARDSGNCWPEPLLRAGTTSPPQTKRHRFGKRRLASSSRCDRRSIAEAESDDRLPAELIPYEAVDLYAKETGFVKSIRVDRGSNVKQGELIAEIEAPELVAQRAQANAAYQSAESQLAAGQAKLAADQATYQHMSAAAKTPGVVAANDLEIARKNRAIRSGQCRRSAENRRCGPGRIARRHAARILSAHHGPVRWSNHDSLRPSRRAGRPCGRRRRDDADRPDRNRHPAPAGGSRAGE